MRHTSLFYRLFPPPKFLLMPHAGLEISDDALRCLEYKFSKKGLEIARYDKTDLPPGVIENGEVKDRDRFLKMLGDFVHKNHLSYVKVSLPEEKVYLFQIDIPSRDAKEITQHVEFKLEENVPLSAADSVFYFDVLPAVISGNVLRASVSVAAEKYVENMHGLLESFGLVPVAFEVAPKSIAKALVPKGSSETHLVVHVMNRKTGTYIVCGGVVCFSSTLAWGSRENNADQKPDNLDVDLVAKEVRRVYDYWTTRPDAKAAIDAVILVGEDADVVEKNFKKAAVAGLPLIREVDVWQNAFDINKYVPPISREESLEYAVAAGLALP